jgi:hypothetical protein
MARSDMYRKLPWRGGNPREVSEVVNNLVEGKSNNTGEFTLNTGNATTTTIFDERIGNNSVILFAPLTLSAAATNAYPYGTFEERADITFATANTPQILDLSESEYTVGMSLASNRITVSYAGVYDLDVSALFVNTAVQIHEAYIWVRINGTDVPHSATKFSVIERHGGVDGYMPINVNHPLELDANDYVEVVASVDNTGIYLENYVAQATPFVRPAIPALMVNLQMIDPSQTTGSAHELYVSNRQKGQATVTHLPNNVSNKTYGYVIIG